MTADRYVLGIAFKAGRDDRVRKGADGRVDYADADVVEKAAWAFNRSGRQIGVEHADGTVGAADVVESYLYRGPDWLIKSDAEGDVVVREGDWLIGAILDEPSWARYQRGEFTGFSPQGRARRRPATRSNA